MAFTKDGTSTTATATIQADTDALQVDTASIISKVDADKAVDDLGATAAALTTVGSNVTTALTRIGTPATSLTVDVAAVKSVVDAGATAAALTTTDAKIGSPVNTGGTATLSDILGDPANVSFVTRVAHKSYYPDSWFHSTDLGSADPTDGDLTLPTTQATSYTILAIKDLTIPGGTAGTITRVAYSVKWSGIVANGGGPVTGNTRLEMATSANTQNVGDVSTGTAITATQSETVATATRTISHHIRPSFLSGTGKVRIFLVGKVDDAQDTLTVNGFDTSEFEVTYEVI